MRNEPAGDAVGIREDVLVRRAVEHSLSHQTDGEPDSAATC